MNHGGRWLIACVLVLTMGLAGCGGDDPDTSLPDVAPTSTDTAAADEQAAIEAFTRFWDETVKISNSGTVPPTAYAETAVGAIREDEILRRTQDSEAGAVTVGRPKFKNQTVAVDGDRAVVVTCINTDEWGIRLGDAKPVYASAGWRMLGREVSRIDGAWIVSGYSPENTKDDCR